VRDAEGQPVFGAAGVAAGSALRIEFHDGALGATATGPAGEAAPAPKAAPLKPKPAARPKRGPGGDDPQGSLL
jgi:exodeoxyribonuclease VII large subunit